MPGIRVLTHNGKPPEEGGLRIGYFVDGGTTLYTMRWGPIPIVRSPPPAAPVPPKSEFDALPMEPASQQCPDCRSFLSLLQKRIDGEFRIVAGCRRCDKIFRPCSD